MALMETPTDSYGMPLQILSPTEKFTFKNSNRHHLWHPRTSLSEGTIADRALRHSIVERLPIRVHNDYHAEYGGPKIPTTDSDKFFLTILGRIGYRSQEVLNYNQSGRKRLPYNPRMASFINVFPDSGTKGVDGQDDIKRVTGLFLARYAIEQDVGHLEEIDEFLHTEKVERRFELGAIIIKEGIRVAVDPHIQKYQEAVNEQRIPKGQRGGLFSVVTGIFGPNHIPDYIQPLTERLMAA